MQYIGEMSITITNLKAVKEHFPTGATSCLEILTIIFVQESKSCTKDARIITSRTSAPL